jgi:hypothetical protein
LFEPLKQLKQKDRPQEKSLKQIDVKSPAEAVTRAHFAAYRSKDYSFQLNWGSGDDDNHQQRTFRPICPAKVR